MKTSNFIGFIALLIIVAPVYKNKVLQVQPEGIQGLTDYTDLWMMVYK